MLAAKHMLEKVSETQVIRDISVDFEVYETSILDVIYRWGNFKKQIIDLQNFSRHQMSEGQNLNDKHDNHTSRTYEIFNRYQLISRKSSVKSPSFF